MRDGWRETTLGALFAPSNERLGAHESEPTVFSISKYDGVIPADEFFGKRVASAKLDDYKVLLDDAWVYSTIHIDEGSIARNTTGTDGVVSPMYTVMRWTSEIDDPGYAELLLRSAEMLAVYSDNAQGSINRRRSLPWKAFASIPIAVPPPGEQRRIVDLIAAVDDAVDAAEAEADTAKTARDEMLTAMLAARDGWRETTLGELADVLRGAVWRKSDEVGAPDDQHEAVVGIGVTTAGGVINRAAMKYVSGLGDKAKRLAAGDTLMVMSNGNHSRIGNAYAIPDDFVGMPFSAFQAAVRVRERDVVTPTFLSILLGSEELQQAFTDSAAGSTGLGNLKVTYLRAIPIALPPIDEQRRIVATVKSVDDALDAARATAESLRTLRSNLLTVLLSGEHEIPASYDALLGEVA